MAATCRIQVYQGMSTQIGSSYLLNKGFTPFEKPQIRIIIIINRFFNPEKHRVKKPKIR
jgi:hypothetical protein